MPPQPVILESQNATSVADSATIERRIRISQPDERRGRCKGSRAWDRRKDFSQCMQQHKIPSTSKPSHLNKNAPSLQGLSHAGVARSRRRGVSHLGQNPEGLRRGAECARGLEHLSEGVPLRLDGHGFCARAAGQRRQDSAGRPQRAQA
jgi:hypothetical protein